MPHAALGIGDLRAMVGGLPPTLAGFRDRSLLLVGFGGALRRSDLGGIDVERLNFARDGLIIALVGGRRIGIPAWGTDGPCPVRAARAWLDEAGLTHGPLFRAINRHGQLADGRLSDKAVALVVKRAATAAGLDPGRYAGDSLRFGLQAPPSGEGDVEWRPSPRAA